MVVCKCLASVVTDKVPGRGWTQKHSGKVAALTPGIAMPSCAWAPLT